MSNEAVKEPEMLGHPKGLFCYSLQSSGKDSVSME